MPDDAAAPAANAAGTGEPKLIDDLVAGWLGGAVGILASNPFEVLVHCEPRHMLPLNARTDIHPASTIVFLTMVPATHPSTAESAHANGCTSKYIRRYPVNITSRRW